GSHLGPIGVDLTPLNTEIRTATADAFGFFCIGQVSPGCFGKGNCVMIQENGSAPGQIRTGMTENGIEASIFCIPATGNGSVDSAADLPGPGAVSLPFAFTATN